MPDAVALKLKKISHRTIDRLLHKTKQEMKIRGASGAKPVRLLHRAIPIVTWFEYALKPTGFFQIDLVQHDGGNPAGEFCFTLTMTDVKTGWTIHFALRNKAATWVTAALDKAFTLLPMGLKGVHSDAGSEFINRPVDLWRQRHGVEFSRGRPTHKNDNCYVEQKNYAAVRKIVGYFRCEGEEGVAALQAVYDAYNPLLNLHCPCMKQMSCERIGAKKKRNCDSPRTPLRRLLEQSFEDMLEGRRVKLAALALKEAAALVEQSCSWIRLLTVCLIPRMMCRSSLRVAEQTAMVRILHGASGRLWFVFYVVQHGGKLRGCQRSVEMSPLRVKPRRIQSGLYVLATP
jgi:hypothetical protein